MHFPLLVLEPLPQEVWGLALSNPVELSLDSSKKVNALSSFSLNCKIEATSPETHGLSSEFIFLLLLFYFGFAFNPTDLALFPSFNSLLLGKETRRQEENPSAVFY